MTMTPVQQANEKKIIGSFMGEIPCDTCKHDHQDGTCKAFPKGIPTEILSGRHDHRFKPHPLDAGIMYDSATFPLASEI